MSESKIQWTEATWNPIRAERDPEPTFGDPLGRKHLQGWHCERVSPGCENCYAETQNKAGFRGGTLLGYTRPNRDKVRITLHEPTLLKPLSWKKPRLIFPCSMTDLFGEWVTDEMLDRIFAVMALCGQHTFQVLTKRPERTREYLTGSRPDHFGDTKATSVHVLRAATAIRGALSYVPWPLRNVWCGVSAEDQQRADERVPVLLDTPAAVRWVSYEPALGAVEFNRLQPSWLPREEHPHDPILRLDALQGLITGMDNYLERDELGNHRKLDWIVVGGESGPGTRPFDLAWARSTIAQCKAAGVPVFVKQLGAKPSVSHSIRQPDEDCPLGWVGKFERTGMTCRHDRTPDAIKSRPSFGGSVSMNHVVTGQSLRLRDRKGGDMAEWPADLRVREMPS